MNENSKAYYEDGYDLILPIEFSYHQPFFWGNKKACAYHAVKFTHDFGPYKKGAIYKCIELSFDGNKGEITSEHFDGATGPHYYFYKNSMDGTAYIKYIDVSKISEVFIEDFGFNSDLGLKESESKLEYELDFDFITALAERMATNKGKYPPYNWKKPMDVSKLKQAMFRHVVEVMEDRYKDDNRELGHLEAIACNVMMIMYQLKKQNECTTEKTL